MKQELKYIENFTQKIRADKFIQRTMAEEGGFVDCPSRIDQPTNTGITIAALNNFNRVHPNNNFPANVKDLTPSQIRQIYRHDYYFQRRINEIKNERIAFAIFDMGVMSNFHNVVKMVQRTLNTVCGSDLCVDGILGCATINALNNIDANKIELFIRVLKDNRLRYLRCLDTWPKYGKGWSARTIRY